MDHREGMPYGWPPDSARHRPPPLDERHHYPPPPPPSEYLSSAELLAAQYRPPPGLYPPPPLGGGPGAYQGMGGLQPELGPGHYPPPPLEQLFPPPPQPPPSERLLYQEEPHYLSMQEPPPPPLPQQHQRHYLPPEELHRLRLQRGGLGPLGGAEAPLQRHLSSPAGLQSPPPPLAPYHADTPPPAVRFSPRLTPFAAEPERGGEGEFGTARISDNLAAHLSQMEARPAQFEPSPPPPAAPAGGQSFLSSLFGGWRGDAASADAGLPVSFGVKPEEQPPSPPPPAAEAVQEPEPAAPVTPEPAAASPAPSPAAPAEPPKPSYSAVLTKPRPPPGPPASAQRGPETAAAAAGRTPAAGPRGPAARGESESGGSRRGGRGGRRRRSSSDTVSRPAAAGAGAARGSPAGGTPVHQPAAAAAQDSPPAAQPPPPPQPPPQPPGKPADAGKKKKRTGKTTRSESSDDITPGRRAETLNNNPDRAQPTVQRRPLNYNNNLGSSSTLGPAQTHVHTPPPPPVAGDAKKIDVNVGKQKNCAGKTSNESKKVVTEETMNKPDNKTLSQSRGSQPLNLLTPGGAAKSERVNKELTFRPRPGRPGGGRARRDPTEPTSDLARRLAAQLTPGLALVGTLLAWLAHLVCDVTVMSSRLIGVLLLSVAEAGRLRACRAAGRVREAVAARLAAVREWWRRPAAAAAAGGLAANIALPATGDDAMKRLLACKDKDPYSILGVTHDCTDADIKKYYKRQALLVHPDKSRSPGAEEAFKILRRAFELVGFPEQRAAFDAQAREQREVDLAFRQYTEELMTRLREKIEETQNTLRCNNCNQRHRRTRTQRPCYAARACGTCKIQHAAREGDIWAESSWLGLFWRYYACMDGGVFDISEWAACQAQSLKHLQANHHTVQYRIISGAKKHKQPQDEPSDRDLEDILSNLYNNGSMAGEPAAGQRRRGGRRRVH